MAELWTNLSTSFVANINFRYDTWKGAKDTRKRTWRKRLQKRRKSKDKWKSPPKHRTGSIRNLGKDQGQETNLPHEGSGQGGPPVAPHHSTHTPLFGAIHLTFVHLFFSLDSAVEQGKAIKESLSPRRILELLGWIQFSSPPWASSYLIYMIMQLN